MVTPPALALRQAGQNWLLSCADDPAPVRAAWNAAELAPITSGLHWRVAEAPLVHAMEAIKRIGPRHLGPVLADVMLCRAWWLLPPGLDDELDDVRMLTVQPRGWPLRCAPVSYAVRSRVWVERPDGTGRLTDPTMLGASLSPGGGSRCSARTLG
ncbi:hypothetical protein ACWERY_05365 [Streptomyces sp. NPDC004082]|uniref:hypothetical protein n=1 Tax=Streptomyces sp. NPDC005301 TaxID=3156874 RepID=UPI0033ABC5DA